ncbi:hypothetical protein RHGRI_021020 [Rhododendron griersonianum]|uniref:Lipoyl-binding domain-containing protein n=1 Tax=Rhododendron griersonianum TaxID=479676 RepID=A0AAV6JIT8_9ERIC|nr:hypothetical protein RHGRI_021020 [Rhododendron griersonianum]
MPPLSWSSIFLSSSSFSVVPEFDLNIEQIDSAVVEFNRDVVVVGEFEVGFLDRGVRELELIQWKFWDDLGFGGVDCEQVQFSITDARWVEAKIVLRTSHWEIFLPAPSSTMTEGKIVSWIKSEGDVFSKAESVVVVESDKADMDVETFYDGILAAIVVAEGEVTPIGLLAETEADVPEAKAKAAAVASSSSSNPSAPPPAVPSMEFWEKTSDDMPMPTYFRFVALLAFKIFSTEQVDVAILEFGLGRRFDATNVVQTPIVCGISSL